MAKSKDNVVMHGVSGKLWDLLVFRQRKGQTLLGKIPKKSGANSPDQNLVRRTFKKAVAYAKSVMDDLALKLRYEKKVKGLQTAFNLAVADYFQLPVIGDIDLTQYTGLIGSTIKVQATDDFEVASVKLKISKPDGTLVEEGDAIMQPDGLDWLYTSTTNNPSFAGNILTVTAIDRPGHPSEKQQTL